MSLEETIIMNLAAPHIPVALRPSDVIAVTGIVAGTTSVVTAGSVPLAIVLAVALGVLWRRGGRSSAFIGAGALLLIMGAMVLWPATPHAVGVPPTPAGVTAIALDHQVSLSWQTTQDASSYSVWRGTSKTSVATLVATGITSTSYTDNNPSNGSVYYYAVRAASSVGTSPASSLAQATPQARSCSTGNTIVRENCFPGTTAWKTTTSTPAWNGGIEGYLTATSVNAGGSLDLKVDSSDSTTFHAEIYRTGSYGGSEARLISTLPGIQGQAQAPCDSDLTGTGVVDCSGWDVSATITTNSNWVSGVYLVRLVRDDNGAANEALFIVRKDGSTSDVLYKVPTNTYQAYNNYGTKALYEFLSDTPNTIAGTSRAVRVSFDRPFTQPGHQARFDWYPNTDIEATSWLESQGYDVTYIADEDLETTPTQVSQHKILISGVHDEYWSQNIATAFKNARNAGTDLLFLGANASYWKVRYAASPSSGQARRSLIAYKTIQSGPTDPGGPTTTWRDPVINQPENALIGEMYIGDNSSNFFPLKVSASEGSNRVWRHTALHTLAPGTSTTVGTTLVGWEWDARVANGQEPSGVATLSSTPVNGNLLQGNGASYGAGLATANSTIYTASSGAEVFATGTNHWARGLGQNQWGDGEPSGVIRQATANVLSDMGVDPTNATNVTVDPSGAPVVSTTTPAAGATNVSVTSPIKTTFDRDLDPSSVGASDLTLSGTGVGSVAGAVTYDEATKTITFTPTDALEANTAYTATLSTAIKSWRGSAPSSSTTWTFNTGQGSPPSLTSSTPAASTVNVATDATVTAKFNRRLNPATITASAFTLAPAAGGSPVAATVSYDDATRSAKLTPSTPLLESTAYTATLTTGITATDGVPVASAITIGFTTGANLSVSAHTPATFANGISPLTNVRAVLNKPVDAASVTASAFALTGPGGAVAGTVSYDANTRTVAFTPASPLALMATYTATVSGLRGSDGSAQTSSTWTFSTPATAPAAPSASALAPATGATGVSNSASVTAVFDQAMDPNTINTTTFTLKPTAGSPLAATVTYDAASRKATLNPTASLDVGTNYTATLTTSVRSTTGAPLPSTITWTFTSSNCPCSLMDNLTPTDRGIAVRDNRPAPGPWTYELGTRFTVTTTTQLVALRFWKEPGETGTHVGRLWNASGTQLTSATFSGESASGWQRQALTSAVTLSPGIVYTASVGVHDVYAKTPGGLAAQMSGGPLRSVADGVNGSYAASERVFPDQTWASSNYFVDPIVKMPSEPNHTPTVSSQSPLSGATGVGTGSAVTATFSKPLDPTTVNSTNFTLKDAANNTIAATVTYDDATNTARLVPSAALGTGASYTARLGTGIRGDDETPMASAVSWSFATVAPSAPVVTSGSPVQGSTQTSTLVTPTVVFDQAMDASTITSSAFTLKDPGGTSVPASVSYDAPTMTATLTPTSALTGSTTYTATVSTAVKSARSVGIAAPETFSFTTSACPCRLFDASVQRSATGLSTSNGRGAGAWTLEMGMKIKVSQPAELDAVRYYRDAAETGTHVGRVWSASGTLLASANYTGETSSGWQEANLATPIKLVPGQTYVVSVGLNSAFAMTMYGLSSTVVNGPLLSVVDGANGVYADAAGTFPTTTWGQSNYFVDAMVR
jgi:hypothetical protein